jgi:hypothetical protein
VLEQVEQHARGLFLETDSSAILAKFRRGGVHFEHAESHNPQWLGIHRSLLTC